MVVSPHGRSFQNTRQKAELGYTEQRAKGDYIKLKQQMITESNLKQEKDNLNHLQDVTEHHAFLVTGRQKNTRHSAELLIWQCVGKQFEIFCFTQ